VLGGCPSVLSTGTSSTFTLLPLELENLKEGASLEEGILQRRTNSTEVLKRCGIFPALISAPSNISTLDSNRGEVSAPPPLRPAADSIEQFSPHSTGRPVNFAGDLPAHPSPVVPETDL
jgi:hypothetical protein